MYYFMNKDTVTAQITNRAGRWELSHISWRKKADGRVPD